KAAPEKAAAKADDFPQLFNQWRELVARLSQIRARYQTDASADKKALEAEFNKYMKDAQDLAEPLALAAQRAYAAAPNEDKELTGFLVETMRGYIQGDDYEKAARIGKLLVANKCEHQETNFLAGVAFFNVNDFENAATCLQAAKDNKLTNEHGN